MKNLKISLSSLAALSAVCAHSAGFEKATVWSGQNAALGAAVVSSVGGGEALFFNPAGLARPGVSNGDIQLNYSPTYGKHQGPIVEDGDSSESKRHHSPIFGVTSAYRLSDKLGVGAGVFVSAGSRSDYPAVDYSGLHANADLKPAAKSEMSVLEASLGAGYEIIPGLRIGAAWRAAFVKAAISSPQVQTFDGTGGTTALIGLDLSDLSDSNYASFRVGAQYDGAGWGVGLNARSKIEFTAEGQGGGNTEFVADGAFTGISDLDSKALQSADVTIASQLPLQMELGAHVELPSDLVLFAAYNWTDYSQINEIPLTGTVKFSDDYTNPIGGREVDLSESPFATRWKDQHMIKTGLQWNGLQDIPLRVGYVYVSQVTPNGFARATFASPGVGQVFTAGAGYKIREDLKFDGAFEYAMTSGTVSADDTGASDLKTGEYKTNAFVIHTGLNYAF